MATLLGLARRLEQKTLPQIQAVGNRRAIATAEAIIRELLVDTPVDVSTALSNWQISVGNIVPNIPLLPYVPGSHGSTRGSSMAEAMAVALNNLRAKKPGEPIYISNVIDYIGELNRGSSPQQPAAGFIERAVMRGRMKSKRAGTAT